MTIPAGAETPATPATTALFDQIAGELESLVKNAEIDLSAGWNHVRLVDVLAGEYYHILEKDSETRVAIVSLLATAVVQLAQEARR